MQAEPMFTGRAGARDDTTESPPVEPEPEVVHARPRGSGAVFLRALGDLHNGVGGD